MSQATHDGFVVRLVTPAGLARVLDFQRPAPPPAPILVAPQATRRRDLPWVRNLSRLLVAFAILQVLDLASTLLLLSIGGQEANPLSAWLLRHGVGVFVATKLVLAASLLALVPFIRRERRPRDLRAAAWTCFWMDCLYVLAVASNLVQFALFA